MIIYSYIFVVVVCSSPLLSSLRQYEVVAINSDALHSMHPESIALSGSQSKSSDRKAVRTFSQHIGLSFKSFKKTMHIQAYNPDQPIPSTDYFSDSSSSSSSDYSHSPIKEFNLELSRMDDLFHPDYSEIRQHWENGERRMDLEQVKC